ncbi:MAG: wax ester/triacylglycerol synthase family O-acyltransferase [Solirubrobacteraceae bacterium]
MRQLTSLDTQFLALENDRQTGHVGGLAILDPATTADGTLDVFDVQALILERLPLLPPLRWRLAEVPLALDYPYWVDDVNFDIEFHVREMALPAPGSDVQLAEQVARIASRPLDRARPLWELYLIHGLAGGHVAMLTKIHHALIDGMSGAEIMGLLLDLGPDGPELPREPGWRGEAEQMPGTAEMLARAMVGLPRYPLRALRALPHAIPNIEDTPFGTFPGAGLAGALLDRGRSVLAGRRIRGASRYSAPRTSFNGRLTPHRRFTFGQLSLDDVKEIKNANSCTVNDVIVCVCAGAVRRWLLEHDELPQEPLVAQIPVSVRSGEEIGTYGNKILLMSAPLLTNVEDPLERLRQTHDALSEMKERHRALPATLLQDANNFIPPAVFARAAQLTFRLSTSGAARPTWNLVISNVPGPQIPLFCAGARLVANYPVSVITDGMGLNITVMSYMGSLDFGIVADREQMPDLARMMGWLGESLSELKPRKKARARTGRRSSPNGSAPAKTPAGS